MPPPQLKPLSQEDKARFEDLLKQLPRDRRGGDDIVATVRKDRELTVLYGIAERCGVLDLLREPGPFTIFAPTNSAWAELGKAKLDSITENRDSASQLLQNHGIQGQYTVQALEELGQARSVYGLTLLISRNPSNPEEVWIGPWNAVVKRARADIRCSNGVIHVIDGVLEPIGLGIGPARGPVTRIGLRMLTIPGGVFQMGTPPPLGLGTEDEGPQRTVQVSTFYLGEHEVTSKMYQELNPDQPNPAPKWIRELPPDQYPIGAVTWIQAVQFCNALSKLEGLVDYYEVKRGGDGILVYVPDLRGNGYRLPTEAEWEYACRAGSTGKFFFGNNEAKLNQYAWCGQVKSHPVRMKEANDWGLYDMYGNVAEWCEDWYAPYQEERTPLVDPRGPTAMPVAKRKVYRGGSYVRDARYCRSAWRGSAQMEFAHGAIGFRVARTPERGARIPDLPFPVPGLTPERQ
jgi:formylglycine-generating enzyme required for sulfatase activity/uncharacterized surface protein with fasciclin (FAS1) repeats